MSQWTHVAGVIRLDWLGALSGRELPLNQVLGNIVTFDDPIEKETPLPAGSEGSLEYTVWTNPRGSAMAHYTIAIWGDLRDYEDAHGIINWFRALMQTSLSAYGFNGIVKDLCRAAILKIDVEYKESWVVHVVRTDDGDPFVEPVRLKDGRVYSIEKENA